MLCELERTEVQANKRKERRALQKAFPVHIIQTAHNTSYPYCVVVAKQIETDYTQKQYLDRERMGVDKAILKEGDGATFPAKGDTLTMHYTGTLASDGSKFDSSVDRNKPFQFVIGIGQVIKGWDEGVMQMSLGEKANLKISSDYGYGARGAGGAIPPNADLNFEVELLAIGNKNAPGFDGSSGGGCNIL